MVTVQNFDTVLAKKCLIVCVSTIYGKFFLRVPTITTLTRSMWIVLSLTIIPSFLPQLSHSFFHYQFPETKTLSSRILELASPQVPSVGFQ